MEFMPKFSMEVFPICTIYLTTRSLMSICFDLVELMLLLEYMTTGLLSQYNLCGLSIPSIICILVTRFLNQIPWLDASKHAINSVVMVDNESFLGIAPRNCTIIQHVGISKSESFTILASKKSELKYPVISNWYDLLYVST